MQQMKKVKGPERERRRMGWTIVVALNLLVVVALLLYGTSRDRWSGVTFGFLSGDATDSDGPDGPILRLPDVVVGLRSVGGDLYVDAAFDLEVASVQDREAVRRQLPRVRNETIAFLSELSPEELRGSDELARTKARLLERYRNVLPSQRLSAIYLSYLAIAHVE